MTPGPSRRLEWTALAVLTAGLMGINESYYRRDLRPPAYDQAWYLETSLLLYQAFTDQDWGRLAYHYRTAFQIKAPLISVLPLPFYLLLGPGPDSALAANSLLLAVSNVYLFLLGHRLFSAAVGFWAVIFYQTMPLAYGLSRTLLTESAMLTVTNSDRCRYDHRPRTQGRCHHAGLGHCPPRWAWGAPSLVRPVGPC